MARWNFLIPLAFSVFLCTAQEQLPAPGGSPTAIEGCLSKGSKPHQYVLTTEKGEKTVLLSSEDLTKHLSHKVRVTGSAKTENSETVLRVQAVEHVSNSCGN